MRHHFVPLREPPSDVEVARLLAAVRGRIIRLLRRHDIDLGGDFDDGRSDPLALESPVLAQVQSASVLGRVATGPRAGQRVMRLRNSGRGNSGRQVGAIQGTLGRKGRISNERGESPETPQRPPRPLQHGAAEAVIVGQPIAQPEGERQNPLAHRQAAEHAVDEVRGELAHAPAAARRTDAPLAREGDEDLSRAAVAAKARKPARHHPAGQELAQALVTRPAGPRDEIKPSRYAVGRDCGIRTSEYKFRFIIGEIS